MNPDFTLEFIKDDQAPRRLADLLLTSSTIAVDIETVEWWNRSCERIVLIQFAFPQAERVIARIANARTKGKNHGRPPLTKKTKPRNFGI